MNIKLFTVKIEDMTRCIADNKKAHPVISECIVEEKTRSDAMDAVVWREIESIRAAVGDVSSAIAEKRIRITARITHSVSAVGHDGLTRAQRDELRANKKAARKAQKAAQKANKKAAKAATITAKDGRAVAIPDGAKATRHAKTRAAKVA